VHETDQSDNAMGWGALAPINGGLAQGKGRSEVKYQDVLQER
jgi:hypothetical protein